jgi:hypothetical protein
VRIISLLLGVGLVGAAGAANDILNRAKAVYEQTVVGYLAEYDAQVEAWQDKVLTALKAKRSRLQKAGDLDGWSAADREVKRFGTARDITAKDVAAAPASMRKLLQRCCDMKASYRAKRDRQILALHEKYIANLEKLQVRLTKAGKMDAAFAVKAEIERANDSRTIAAARFAVDAEESKRPAAPPPSRRAPATPAVKPTAASGSVKTDDGSVIYPPGTTPKRDNTLVLKRTTMHRTPHVEVGSRVSVSAWEGSRRKGRSSSSGSSFNTYRTKTRADDRFLRLMLRTGQAGLVLADLHVRVEYFGQNVSSSSQTRAAEPTLDAVRSVKLGRLSQVTRYVDLSPATFGTSSSRYRSSYSDYSYSSKSGRRYFGAIVTVFSPKGELLYQGATRPQLREHASGETPDFALAEAEKRVELLHKAYNAASLARSANPDDGQLDAAYQRARGAYYAARSELSTMRAAKQE